MPDTDSSKQSRLTALIVVSIALLALCLAIPALAAANANFVGAWSPSTGQPWTVTSQEAGGGCTGTTSLSGFTFTDCHVSGNEYEFFVDQEGSSYESRNHGTIEGNKLTGEFNDTVGHNVPYTAVREGGGTTVSGKVLDQKGRSAEGVTVKLTGKSDEGETVAKTTTAGSGSTYSFEVPAGTYQVTASGDPTNPVKQYGGSLAVAKENSSLQCSGAASEATCSLTHLGSGEEGHASFTYTQCGSPERTVEGHEPTNCPIIFVPGILGSRIVCKTGQLYIAATGGGAYFKEMELQPDGEHNATANGCNASAEVPAGEEGLLMSVAGQDAYGQAWEWVKRIATNGAYVYPFDWRRGVDKASEGLEPLVEKALSDTGAKHVVLVAHSMGGLVVQQYILGSENAKKVTRALTIGTPYWGAPKSLIALLDGHTNEFAAELADGLFGSEAVQKAAGNYTGLFWLYPSDSFGKWLKITGKGFSGDELGSSEIGKWIASLGATPALLQRALAGHAALDGFKPNGVDYQIVVGAGVPTITKMAIAVNEFEPEQWVSATYGSGDGTVPAISQTQGAFPGPEAGGGVPINYVCGVTHSREPATPSVQGRVEDFVLHGGKITGSESACPYTGGETVLYHTPIADHGKAAAVTAPPGTVTLEKAISEGLVQVLELGDRTIITTNGRQPVKLALNGSGVSFRVRSIDNEGGGKPFYYGPVSGTVVLSGTTLTKGSKRLKGAARTKPPRTVARVTRHGKRFLVRLATAGKRRALAIYYRIGNAKSRRYTGALRLSRKQLRALRFSSLGQFGEWGPAGRARLSG
jgi:pimeloyl-ACP methyl ester carboxylesterase